MICRAEIRTALRADGTTALAVLRSEPPITLMPAPGNLVHLVVIRDMGTFNPDRFKDWIKDTDARFRKVGLTLLFDIRSRTVHFTIKEIRSRRTASCLLDRPQRSSMCDDGIRYPGFASAQKRRPRKFQNEDGSSNLRRKALNQTR